MPTKLPNPAKQTDNQIVKTLLENKTRQYTEAAHAEMMKRFNQSIQKLDQSSARQGQRIFWLTLTIVCLTILNVLVTYYNIFMT